MIRSSFITMLWICVVWAFCGEDFVTVGRHSWRFKQRINQPERDPYDDATRQVPTMQSPNVPILSRTVVKCCCGKICKGTRGLKMHQRSCQVLHGLNDEMRADLEEQMMNNNDDTRESDNCDSDVTANSEECFPEVKKGVKLPKNDKEWLTANEYFKYALQFDDPIKSQDDNFKINHLTSTIYNYFADNYGYNETLPDKDMLIKYKEYTIKELKKALQDLKSNKGDVSEIKYVSRTLRDKLRIKSKANSGLLNSNVSEWFNYDNYLGRNFWNYSLEMNTKTQLATTMCRTIFNNNNNI